VTDASAWARWNRIAVAVVLCWAALSLVLIYNRGIAIGSDRNVADRYRYHAIPVVLSSMYLGRPWDYTAFKSVAFPFQGAGDVDTLIAATLKMNPKQMAGDYFWTADDRGTADYVWGAFHLFGPRSSSLYRFYFVLLGLSSVLFVIQFRRHPAALALLPFALAALYASIAVLPLANLNAADRPSLFEPRTIEMLAFVATLHLALAPWFDDALTPGRLAASLLQCVLFVECYHARSSIGWEALFVVLSYVTVFTRLGYRAIVRRVEARAALVRAAVLSAVFIGAFAGLNVYRHLVYARHYFEGAGTRVVWHNALMGFGINRNITLAYHVDVNDAHIVEAVATFLKTTGDPRYSSEWNVTNVLNSFGGHSDFNWEIYESAARDLYFKIWREHPRDALHTYLVDKPLGAPGIVREGIFDDGRPERRAAGLFFNPFSPAALLLACPGLVLVVMSRARYGGYLAAAVVLAVLSFLPGIMFYSVIVTMGGTFMALAMVAYLGAAELGSLGARLVDGWGASA